MHFDPLTWADIATAVAAWLALILSILSLFVSWRAQRLTERQEERRRPVLVPYLLDGYVRLNKEPAARVYAFLLSVSNPADSDNAVAGMDLHLLYTTQASIQMTVKVRADATLGSSFCDGSAPPLTVPARIDAHQTISGWAYFRIQEAILNGAVIDGYSVVLIDSHGGRATVEPIMVREYGDAT